LAQLRDAPEAAYQGGFSLTAGRDSPDARLPGNMLAKLKVKKFNFILRSWEPDVDVDFVQLLTGPGGQTYGDPRRWVWQVTVPELSPYNAPVIVSNDRDLRHENHPTDKL